MLTTITRSVEIRRKKICVRQRVQVMKTGTPLSLSYNAAAHGQDYFHKSLRPDMHSTDVTAHVVKNN